MVEHSWVVLLNSPSQQVVDHFDFLPLNLIAMLQKKKKEKTKSQSYKFPAYFICEIKKEEA
jgi:hypothetical protein